MLLVLALISAIAPLSMDMYLPGMPAMADGLGTSASTVQLTLTTFTAGLGLGQLLVGPLSDGLGRRRLMVGATTVTAVAAIACALAPTIEILVAVRAVHGFAGGAAIVLARAAVADRATGDEAARLFSLLMVITGIAPIVAPLLGGALVGPFGWRGIFWVLAGLAVVMAVGAITFVPETLPPEHRKTGGLRALASNVAAVSRNRRYLGYAIGFIASFGAMFAYISASPFVYQDVLGRSPGEFSIAFAVNATGIVLATTINARVVGRIHARTMLLVGVSMIVAGGFGVAILVLTSSSPAWWAVTAALFVSVSGMGFVLGNATALAQSEVRYAAGTGAALMGAGQFLLAAAVSPLVGLAGSESAVPMAIAIPSFGLLALAAVLVLTRGGAAHDGTTDPAGEDADLTAPSPSRES
ncbi:MFS transporter [Rhodococcus rhodnii]|uniref:Major facilitator superfamily multidrug n=2 Tax=Rhodococcus rhodnii TaxID=38312 RepID=R7WL17_9NOCA|nr:multidrug effflux MFS transporter [Rhodococcus rhodnii]EOM75993.1 major facilitator superfamily multidrug [Rhodococcus rhodnii LMG 5362]TXG90834.1 MFS transporter [Rhodococcus rhodnii]